MAPEFASGETRVGSLTVLPTNLTISYAGSDGSRHMVDSLGEKIGQQIEHGVADVLTRRGYDIRQPLSPFEKERLAADLAKLSEKIHDATAGMAAHKGPIRVRVPMQYSQRVGATLGSDATFYTRGWAHINPQADTDKRVRTAMIILAVVTVVALVAIAAASKSKKSSPSKVRGSKRRRRAYRWRSRPWWGDSCNGHCGVHVHAPVKDSATSSMHLAMTMVRNSNGKVLWHAERTFSLNAAREDLFGLSRHFLAQLPPAVDKLRSENAAPSVKNVASR